MNLPVQTLPSRNIEEYSNENNLPVTYAYPKTGPYTWKLGFYNCNSDWQKHVGIESQPLVYL